MDEPTKPKYNRGGCIARAGCNHPREVYGVEGDHEDRAMLHRHSYVTNVFPPAASYHMEPTPHASREPALSLSTLGYGSCNQIFAHL